MGCKCILHFPCYTSHMTHTLTGLSALPASMVDDLDWGEWMDRLTIPTRTDVVAAGDFLRGQITEASADAVAAFNTAYEWREAHLAPLHSVRMSLRQIVLGVGDNWDPLVPGRIKRMSSIRKKLRRSKISLWDIQDIAGVRAVLPDMETVEEVARRIEDGRSIHRLAKQDDYIASPKESGYRSRHLMMRYQGENALKNRSVEIQLRTRRQHAWATTLEAVGLMRGEDLKAGKGDDDWLRFFVLMAGEFACEEGQPMIPGLPDDQSERRRELKDLEARLSAVDTLATYRSAIRGVDMKQASRGTRFIISFDRNSQSVSVRPMDKPATAIRHLKDAEAAGVETVLVEVDSVDALSAAYPNYFMDVAHFVDQVRRSVQWTPTAGHARVGGKFSELLSSWGFFKGYPR